MILIFQLDICETVSCNIKIAFMNLEFKIKKHIQDVIKKVVKYLV